MPEGGYPLFGGYMSYTSPQLATLYMKSCPKQGGTTQWRMQDFLKEGFVIIIAHKVHEILKPHPLSGRTTPVFNRFGVKLLALPVN